MQSKTFCLAACIFSLLLPAGILPIIITAWASALPDISW